MKGQAHQTGDVRLTIAYIATLAQVSKNKRQIYKFSEFTSSCFNC